MAKNILIITGANKGFGRACALAAKSAFEGKDLIVALVGRNEVELANVAAEMNPVPTSIFSEFDCGHARHDHDKIKNFLQDILKNIGKHTNCNCTIIHNAGSVGNPSKTATDLNCAEVTEYMTINLSSAVALNNDFLSLCTSAVKKNVINISSLCAVKACTSLSLYCAGKAARNMYFQVLAKENEDIRVLSYAPGPMDTAMFHNVRHNSCFADTKKVFQEISPILPLQSAEKLMRILKEDTFESGAHIDYYDYT